MNLFMKLDKEVQRALEGAPDESDILPMMECEGKGKGKETLQQRLWRLADDDMDVDEDGRIPDNKPGLSTSVEERHLKRKWQVIYCIGEFNLHSSYNPCRWSSSQDSQDSRKRPRLSESFGAADFASSTSDKAQEELLEAWWEASRSSSLIVGGVPSLPQFDGIQDRRQKAGKGPGLRPAGAKQGGRKRSTRKRAYVSLPILRQ